MTAKKASDHEKTAHAKAKPVKDPGSILDHVMRLVAALRAEDWPTVFALVVDLMGMITNPMECCAGDAPKASVELNTAVTADNLEAFCKASEKDATAFNWQALMGLLLQVLAIFFKQPPAPTPTPSPVQT